MPERRMSSRTSVTTFSTAPTTLPLSSRHPPRRPPSAPTGQRQGRVKAKRPAGSRSGRSSVDKHVHRPSAAPCGQREAPVPPSGQTPHEAGVEPPHGPRRRRGPGQPRGRRPRGDASHGRGPAAPPRRRRAVVRAPTGATAADLIPALAHELGGTLQDQQRLYVDGRVLPPTAPVGAPPLLEGAVITVTPTDPGRPPAFEAWARACSSCTSSVVPTPEPCCAFPRPSPHRPCRRGQCPHRGPRPVPRPG